MENSELLIKLCLYQSKIITVSIYTLCTNEVLLEMLCLLCAVVLTCTSSGESLQSLTVNCNGDLPSDVPQDSLICFLDNDPNPIDCEMN